MKTNTTTIQISRGTRLELLRIKGELLNKDGLQRTFDDIIQELVFYWVQGVRKKGYETQSAH